LRPFVPRKLLTALLALLAAGTLAGPALASARQELTFEAPRELADGSLRGPTLDELRGLGVRAMRVVVYWQAIAPAAGSPRRPSFDAGDPAAYPASSWAALDDIVAGARARGITLQLTLSGPVPRWATRRRRDNLTRPSPREFQRFVTAVGRRYGGRVARWSIWNEPNHPQFLLPQYVRGRPVSASIYRALLLAGIRGLRAAGRGGDPVIMGETAPIGNPKVVAPLTFLRGTLCLSSSYRRSRRCGRLPVDGYAHHPYTRRAGPRLRPPSSNAVTIGTLPRLTRALDRAARAGAIPRRLPIYLTEFGVQSKPDPLFGVTLAQQAEFRSIAELIAYRNRRVAAFSQYLMRDDRPRPGPALERYGGFESGLRFSDGRVKPAYEGFRLPLVVERRGPRVALWGLVRPAGGATAVRVQIRTGTRWRALLTRTTDARGVWRARAAYRRHARWRVVWASPAGTTYTGPATRAY
jgi:hypothetical protein